MTALKNAEYGYDRVHAKSPGGKDGIFILNRNYKPYNIMMKKIFDQYMDKPGSGCEEVAKKLGVEINELTPVRLVSHHLRLLGMLKQTKNEDWLVLVDYDDTK